MALGNDEREVKGRTPERKHSIHSWRYGSGAPLQAGAGDAGLEAGHTEVTADTALRADERV